MKNNFFIFLMILCIQSCAQKDDIYIQKFTSINPVSYTDVVYTNAHDTVLVSTYSGRIAKIINGENKEHVLAQIDDEIYALCYNKTEKQIIASTLTNGLVIINERYGKIIKKIPLGSSWANTIVFSDDCKYLALVDQNKNRYVLDSQNNYANVDPNNLIPQGRIVIIDQNYVATIATSKNVIQWSLPEGKIVDQFEVELDRFSDLDTQGAFLSINFNECSKYDALKKTVEFKIMHPNWPLENPENETEIYEIPLQMQLNAAKFAKQYIFTGGIDRSIRVWNKETGELIKTLSGHKGSICKISVAKDQSQVVSIDLKGVIKFWEVD